MGHWNRAKFDQLDVSNLTLSAAMTRLHVVTTVPINHITHSQLVFAQIGRKPSALGPSDWTISLHIEELGLWTVCNIVIHCNLAFQYQAYCIVVVKNFVLSFGFYSDRIWGHKFHLCREPLFASHYIALHPVGFVSGLIKPAVLWVIPSVVIDHDASFNRGL